MAETKVGIIGCGNIAETYFKLAPLFRGYEITACADINQDAAKARAQEFGVEAKSVADLLADDAIGCVINLTIPAAHTEVSCQILEAGKHVYSEKPLALSLAEAQQIADLAASKDLKVGCTPDTFLGGAHQVARAAIDAGEIGEVTSGSCHVLSAGMEMWHPNPDFFFQPGAGPVLDLGPYYIANLVNLIGPVKRVVAMENTPQKQRTITSEPRKGETVDVNTPTTLLSILEFVSGAKITFSASWDVHAHGHANMELYGATASMFVPDPNFFNGDVVIKDGAGEAKTLPDHDHPFYVANWQQYANYRSAGLADMLLSDDEYRCSLERTMHGVEVMTGILQSAAESTFVDMTTTCTRPAPLDTEAAKALLHLDKFAQMRGG